MKNSKSFWAENRKAIRALILIVLFTGVIANAALTLPFPTFNSGDPIRATEMNQNFAAIKQKIDSQMPATMIVRMKLTVNTQFRTSDAPNIYDRHSGNLPLSFANKLISSPYLSENSSPAYTIFTVPSDGWYEVLAVHQNTYDALSSVQSGSEKRFGLNSDIEIKTGNLTTSTTVGFVSSAS